MASPKPKSSQPSFVEVAKTIQANLATTLAFKALTAEKTKDIMSAKDVDEVELRIVELLNLTPSSKTGLIVDYYVSAMWWTREQGFNAEQTSAFFALLQSLFTNAESHMSLTENVRSLEKRFDGIGRGEGGGGGQGGAGGGRVKTSGSDVGGQGGWPSIGSIRSIGTEGGGQGGGGASRRSERTEGGGGGSRRSERTEGGGGGSRRSERTEGGGGGSLRKTGGTEGSGVGGGGGTRKLGAGGGGGPDVSGLIGGGGGEVEGGGEEGLGGLQGLFNVRQAKSIADYFHTSFFQHYKLYELFIRDENDELYVEQQIDLDVPLSNWPSPLTESVPQEMHDLHIEPKIQGWSAEEEEQMEEDALLEQQLLSQIPVDQIKRIIQSVYEEMASGIEGEISALLSQKVDELTARIQRVLILSRN